MLMSSKVEVRIPNLINSFALIAELSSPSRKTTIGR